MLSFTRQDVDGATGGVAPGEGSSSQKGALATPTGVARRRFATPWGKGELTVVAGRLVDVALPPIRAGEPAEVGTTMDADQTVAERWMSELEAYFAGKRLSWTSREIGLDDLGFGTFAKAVYKALLGVPPATTVSYGELAAMAGYPRAARAVGTAMATNPIPIVIPCHRVIRADGSLGRYGDDPAMKAGLLAHESVHAPTGRGTNVRNTG